MSDRAQNSLYRLEHGMGVLSRQVDGERHLSYRLAVAFSRVVGVIHLDEVGRFAAVGRAACGDCRPNPGVALASNIP